MNPIYTVSEINQMIKDLMESQFPLVSIQGEVSNFRPAASGHWYFTLKDDQSLISAVMFRHKASLVRETIKDGVAVEVTGSLSVYKQRGSYQIICESLSLRGKGNLILMLEERKQRLMAEGLFDPDHKVPLPALPRRIVVITSPTGAAIRDILQVLKRRAPWIDVLIIPVLVQGDSAADQIARALELANTHALGDVIILGRGGGSLEDLLPFSEEGVVRAVYASAIPTVSAVGHETDFSLSDFAADLRAPTPSAAAELVSQGAEGVRQRIMTAGHAVAASMVDMRRSLQRTLRTHGTEGLERSFRQYLQPLYHRLDDTKETLLKHLSQRTQEGRQRLALALQALEAHNPLGILARGYALVRDPADGHVLRGMAEASQVPELDIHMHDGTLRVRRKED